MPAIITSARVKLPLIIFVVYLKRIAKLVKILYGAMARQVMMVVVVVMAVM